jgi:hypothetical protein
MRALSSDEKRIVKILCDDRQGFSALIDREFLYDTIIEIHNDSIHDIHEVHFAFTQTSNQDTRIFNKKMCLATERIVQTINLLNYLLDNAYVSTYYPAHGKTVLGYIGIEELVLKYRQDNSSFYRTRLPDGPSAEFLFDYIDRFFVCTEALKDYVRNGFRTDEQIRHRQNIIAAWVAIGIAIVLGIIGIFKR